MKIISHANEVYALIINIHVHNGFMTPNDCTLQVGVIECDTSYEVKRHAHTPLSRRFIGTSEVIQIISGHCSLSIFCGDELLESVDLLSGDIAVILAGGHSIKFYQKTKFVEIKHGPYLGPKEKVLY
jgi:hypothetical protein